MDIAALIVGIDNWEQYTLPLMMQLLEYEPSCRVVVVDNASEKPYPANINGVIRTPRLCYSAAINAAAGWAGPADWYIVLSNDVVCTGPFAHILTREGNALVGPRLLTLYGQIPYLEGWMVAIPARIWDYVGEWDSNFVVSSWEDVDYSFRAHRMGYNLREIPDLPFKHLDARQRFGLPEFGGTHEKNRQYFFDKHDLH